LLLVSFLLQLEHMFKHRLNSSYRHAVEYLKQFPSPVTSMIAKLVSYIAGAFAAVILLISLIDDSLLEGHVSILAINHSILISVL
jgi:autophagy-related protein 9